MHMAEDKNKNMNRDQDINRQGGQGNIGNQNQNRQGGGNIPGGTDQNRDFNQKKNNQNR